MIVTSNERVSEWAEFFDEEVLDAVILYRLLHNTEVLTSEASSHRLRTHGDAHEESNCCEGSGV